MTQDVMRVMVAMGLSTTGFEAIAVLGRQFLGLQGNISGATNQMNNFGMAVRRGIGALAAMKFGFDIEKGIWHAVEANAELNRELTKTKALGGDFTKGIQAGHMADLKAQAAAPMFAEDQLEKIRREVITGGLGNDAITHQQIANELLPQFAQAAAVISNQTGENKEEILKNLMRTADVRAKIFKKDANGNEVVDQESVVAELEAYSASLRLAGGMAHSNDMLGYARQGGVPVKGMDPKEFSILAVESGIAMGFSKAGTALTSMFQQLVGGTMKVNIAQHLTEAGFMEKGKDWHTVHGAVVMDPKTAQRFQGMMDHPMEYFTSGEGSKKIKDYAKKEGISDIAAIMQLFGRQTTQRFVSELMSNDPQFARAKAMYADIPKNTDAIKMIMGEQFDANVEAITNTWKSFMEELSNDVIPVLIPWMHKLTETFHEWAVWASTHMEDVQKWAKILAVIGGGIMVLGTILAGSVVIALVGVAGAGGIIFALAAGLAAVAVGLIKFDLIPWKSITDGLQSVWEKLLSFLGIKHDKMSADDVHRMYQGTDVPTPPSGYKTPDAPSPADKVQNMYEGGSSLPAIPKSERHSYNINVITNLDGKQLAQNTFRHVVGELNNPMSGTTGSDYRQSYPMQTGVG